MTRFRFLIAIYTLIFLGGGLSGYAFGGIALNQQAAHPILRILEHEKSNELIQASSFRTATEKAVLSEDKLTIVRDNLRSGLDIVDIIRLDKHAFMGPALVLGEQGASLRDQPNPVIQIDGEKLRLNITGKGHDAKSKAIIVTAKLIDDVKGRAIFAFSENLGAVSATVYSGGKTFRIQSIPSVPDVQIVVHPVRTKAKKKASYSTILRPKYDKWRSLESALIASDMLYDLKPRVFHSFKTKSFQGSQFLGSDGNYDRLNVRKATKEIAYLKEYLLGISELTGVQESTSLKYEPIHDRKWLSIKLQQFIDDIPIDISHYIRIDKHGNVHGFRFTTVDPNFVNRNQKGWVNEKDAKTLAEQSIRKTLGRSDLAVLKQSVSARLSYKISDSGYFKPFWSITMSAFSETIEGKLPSALGSYVVLISAVTGETVKTENMLKQILTSFRTDVCTDGNNPARDCENYSGTAWSDWTVKDISKENADDSHAMLSA